MQLADRLARWHLKRQVSDPDLRRKLTPGYIMGCKRILISDNYYPSLDQDNVEVVTDGIAEVTDHAIITTNGTQHRVDTIIFGTGFETTKPPIATRIRGRDGRTLTQHWGEINKYLLDSRLNTARIFLAVQGVLTSAALISKLLWMSQPQRREGCTCPPEEADEARFAQAKRRCRALRKALGIANEMPELNRRVRNSLEHYDDRMDRWLAADDGTIYATGVGPPDSVGGPTAST